ncbi:hypothetical protein GTA09_21210 [Rhodococcus hoagii]|nr:hypothetical protein [Prescottella equi]
MWEKDKSGELTGKPVKLNDDFCDALRYAVTTSRAFWMPYMPTLHVASATEHESTEVAA